MYRNKLCKHRFSRRARSPRLVSPRTSGGWQLSSKVQHRYRHGCVLVAIFKISGSGVGKLGPRHWPWPARPSPVTPWHSFESRVRTQHTTLQSFIHLKHIFFVWKLSNRLKNRRCWKKKRSYSKFITARFYFKGCGWHWNILIGNIAIIIDLALFLSNFPCIRTKLRICSKAQFCTKSSWSFRWRGSSHREIYHVNRTALFV